MLKNKPKIKILLLLIFMGLLSCDEDRFNQSSNELVTISGVDEASTVSEVKVEDSIVQELLDKSDFPKKFIQSEYFQNNFKLYHLVSKNKLFLIHKNTNYNTLFSSSNPPVSRRYTMTKGNNEESLEDVVMKKV